MSPPAHARRSSAPGGRWRRAAVTWVFVTATVARPATAPTATAASAEPAVTLPPMLIEETRSGRPWLYVKVEGTEFLSRCSESTTRDLVESWADRMRLLRVLIPEKFMAKEDAPSVCVLYSQDIEQVMSAEVKRDVVSSKLQRADYPGETAVNVAPNMQLNDRDMHASIAYVDEAQFDGAGLRVAPSYVRYVLSGHVPELPNWLLDGVERLVRGADFVEEPITLQPLVWVDSAESAAVGSDPNRPRALLPPSELFATEAMRRTTESRHPRHVQVRAATQALFVRWAVTSGAANREALWQFASRAAEAPATEEMFTACFGIDFADLRDQLSDFLPKAVGEQPRITPGKLPPLPDVDIQPATGNQIARVRGEWERMAISYVQRRLPAARDRYVDQARRTLHRAYDAGDHDPRLLATMGLCELEANNEMAARPLLEAAIAAGVVRPRAYYELARLRSAELPRDGLLPWATLASVIEPLQQGARQAPALPEIFVLLGESWARCAAEPTADQWRELQRGTALYAHRPDVSLAVGRALTRHGKPDLALAALDASSGYPAADDVLTGVARLRATLETGRGRAPGPP